MEFKNKLTSEDQLLDHYRSPTAGVLDKETSVLDQGCRDFIQATTFLLMGTVNSEGRLDVSPRGGPPGFIKVVDDHHLAIPDLNGNNRLDSIKNIIQQGNIGLLLVIAGLDETLRINGEACVTVDEEILSLFSEELRTPKTAIVVKIEQGFIHCAKSLRRGGLWNPESWPEKECRPSPGQILVDHSGVGDQITGTQLEEILEAGYAHDLAADLPDSGECLSG
tara:strand:+ start:207 stop:872 length:666 start_codon:yes stop_codon:yes gene_type:complete